MKFRLKLYFLSASSIAIVGIVGFNIYNSQNTAQASCRVEASATSNHQGIGACIVRLNNKLLVTQLESGLYDLPVGNKLSIFNNNRQSAQCFAHQSMWHKTGLNVEVKTVVGAQANGMWLFGCELNSGFDGTEAPFDAPQWSNSEVKKVAFIDPFEIDLHNWAHPDQFEIVRDAYVLQGNYQNAE